MVTIRGEKKARAFGGIRSALDTAVLVDPEEGWTNSTFANDLCSKMSSNTTSVRVFSEFAVRFLLPDCFFSASTASLSLVSLFEVIIVGNSAWPNPFTRLAKATNGSDITVLSSTFLYYNGSTNVQPDWDVFFASLPFLTKLAITESGVAGTLPNSLPSKVIYLALSQNNLVGSIPATLFSNYSSSSSVFRLGCVMTSNQLSGTLPSSLFTSLPANTELSISFNRNQISGTIPKDFLAITQSSSMRIINLDLSENSITDTFPTNLWGFPLSMPRLVVLNIIFSNNVLTGTIPSTWFSQYSLPAATSVTMRLENCNISGGVHIGLYNTAPLMSSYALVLSRNPLNSPIPASFISDVLSYASASNPGVAFLLANCGITGDLTLPTPTTAAAMSVRFALQAPANSLTSFTANVNASKYVRELVLANNTAMVGTSIDNLFSSSATSSTSLDLRNTAFTGTLPFMASMVTSLLYTFRMDGVAIDFCSGGSNRTLWTTNAVCTLLRTSAYNCPTLYPNCTTSDPTPISVPVSAPIIAPSPIPLAPPPKPVGCPGSQPRPEFECVNGTWTFTGTVTAPTIVISPGTSEVIVNGNVTSGTVVLQGIGSSITVTGCFTNLSVVTIQLTPEDLKKLGSHSVIQLLNSDGNCSDYSSVAVATTVTRSTCRTVKVDKATTSSGSLNGIFTVSSSGCNLWWIILVSILAVLTIAGVIVLLVVLHIRKKNAHSSAKAALHD